MVSCAPVYFASPDEEAAITKFFTAINDQSIEDDLQLALHRALETNDCSSVASLVQMRSSRLGWCDRKDCGRCPLRVERCNGDRLAAAAELIQKHQDGLINLVPDIDPRRLN